MVVICDGVVVFLRREASGDKGRLRLQLVDTLRHFLLSRVHKSTSRGRTKYRVICPGTMRGPTGIRSAPLRLLGFACRDKDRVRV